jgi:hypothetical protein
MWKTAGADKRAVVRKVWDEIGYNYGPLERTIPDDDLSTAEWSYLGDKNGGKRSATAADRHQTRRLGTPRCLPSDSADPG